MCSHACTKNAYPLSLGDEINAATRKIHARVNRMIIARLFQALPPNCDNAMKYAQGMMGLASLYYNFEVPLCELAKRGKEQKEQEEQQNQEKKQQNPLSQDCSNCKPGQLCDNCHINGVKWVADAYEALHIEALLRSPRIFEDIKALLHNQRSGRYYNVIEAFSMQLMNEQRFSKLRMRLQGSPHLVVAHAWTLYMACHSGGQLIRQVFLSMPVGFWLNEMKLISGPDYRTWLTEEDGATPPEIPDLPADDPVGHPLAPLSPFMDMRYGICGSSFFSFWEIQPDEPTKEDFKEGMKNIEHNFSPKERKEIIEEARRVFEDFETLIKSLDCICGTDSELLDDRAASSWFRGATSNKSDVDTL